MRGTQKQQWFIRWQNLDPKRRYDMIQFIEKTLMVQDSSSRPGR